MWLGSAFVSGKTGWWVDSDFANAEYSFDEEDRDGEAFCLIDVLVESDCINDVLSCGNTYMKISV
jgi:hypothetical protein